VEDYRKDELRKEYGYGIKTCLKTKK